LRAEKVALGKRLFSDKNLSADGSTSCASCHNPAKAFSDTRRVSTGVHKTLGSRNSPALIQAAFSRAFFWDGRTPTLERQVIQPILNPEELGLTEAELERKTGMKTAEIRDALASYVRTIRSTDCNPYLDPRVRPLGLSTGEQKALVAFLKALSGQVRDGL